jgi:hypothetical protein
MTTSFQMPVTYLNYSTNTSFQMPAPYLKYAMTNSFETSVPYPLHHDYHLPNASAIISITPQLLPSKFQVTSRLHHNCFLPNASVISQLHHNYFNANNFQFTDSPISQPCIVQVTDWKGIQSTFQVVKSFIWFFKLLLTLSLFL